MRPGIRKRSDYESIHPRPGAQPDIEVGELLVVVVVYAANVVKDVRENIRNLVGGRMSHYEKLIAQAVELGLSDLEEKAAAKGYDGVLA